MRVAVMGQGYVGLPLAMAAHAVGYTVVGYEPNKERAQKLNAGESYVEDIHNVTLRQALKTGYIAAHKGEEHFLKDFDVAVITVPTPLKDHLPDLSYIEQAALTVAKYLRPGALVILESTTHPGTTRDVLVPKLELSGLTAGQDFHVAFSPERIDPGNKTYQFENTTKVVGGLTPACTELAVDFYQDMGVPCVTTKTPEAAELAKIIENTFRHVNIAFVNEMSRFAKVLDIDLWDALDAAATKPYGYMKFTPGPGVGGHCLPVDPIYLSHHVKTTLGEPFKMIELAQEINNQQPAYIVRRLQDGLNDRLGIALKGARIVALGLAYKPDTADLRESPAAKVVELLRAKGAVVSVVDPGIDDPEPEDHLELPRYWDSFDAAVLLTAHSAFDLTKVADNAAYVLDTRGVMPIRDNIERL